MLALIALLSNHTKISLFTLDCPSFKVFREKNVLKLAMHAEGTGDAWHVSSGAVVQTRDFFASGRYEVRAKVPRVEGMIWALWTFHYETHYDVAHLPAGKVFKRRSVHRVMEAL